MSDASGGGFDVPVVPVASGSAGRRRGRIVLVVVAGLSVVGWALVAGPLGNRGDLAALPDGASRQPTTSRPATTPEPSATNGRMESFVPLPNTPFADAPTPLIIRRDGGDADVFAWTTGEDDVHLLRTFPTAFVGFDDGPSLVTLSPDARALLRIQNGAGQGQDRARLITETGVVWESDAVVYAGSAAWSADSTMLAIAGASDTFWLLTLDSTGGVTPREIPVGPSGGSATVSPSSSADPMAPLVPTGFSVDERWLYGARRDNFFGTTAVEIRVNVDDGSIEAASGLGPAGPGQLDLAAQSFIDPASGRTVRYGPNAATPGGPPTLEVREPDGSVAFRVERHAVGGFGWTGDGRLIVVEADGLPFPNQIRAVRFTAQGDVDSTLLETGAVGGGALFGIVDGYAVLGFFTDRPREEIQIVVIRLSDGATSAVVLTVQIDEVVGAGVLR